MDDSYEVNQAIIKIKENQAKNFNQTSPPLLNLGHGSDHNAPNDSLGTPLGDFDDRQFNGSREANDQNVASSIKSDNEVVNLNLSQDENFSGPEAQRMNQPANSSTPR